MTWASYGGASYGGASFVVVEPDQIEWRDAPTAPGAQFSLLEGNPNDDGLYVMRAKFAPGAMTRPHFHSRDRLVTVISGTWHAGFGDLFAPDATMALPPGSFMKHPAGAAHFDGAKDEEVIVEIRGLGPVTTTAVTGDDDLNLAKTAD
ncbi:MAG: cupin domain-containing protein [Sphingomonadales bacterium]